MRVASEIQRDLPDLIRKHVRLPHGMLVSLTGAELTSDLSLCRVFFSVYGTDDRSQIADIEHLLNDVRGLLRKELAVTLVMRQHPDIRFVYDDTPARAARIELLLKQVRESEKSGDSE